MFKRITLAALVSAAVLTSAALSPASAGHPVMGGMHRPGGFFGPRMPGGGMSHLGGFHQGAFRGPHWHHGPIAHLPTPHHPHWGWHWRHGVYGPVFVDQGYVAPAYATSAPVATCPSNCLAKQYLQDGSVVFTDQCTNESATAPAGSHG